MPSMYIIFEESGRFIAGRVLRETDAAWQLELPAGKRIKLKKAKGLMTLQADDAQQVLERAVAAAPEVDLDLVWEFAPEGDTFDFAQVAADYFGDAVTQEQRLTALVAVHGAPHYFRRAGGGTYRKASREVVEQALAAIAKKAAQEAQIAQWTQQLQAGECPQEIQQQLYRLLFRPEKNGAEYRAVTAAARAMQLSPLALMQHAGALGTDARAAYDFHWQRFIFTHFPQGLERDNLPVDAAAVLAELPEAVDDSGELVQAFSVDDAHTTEIDDALSVQGLGSGTVTVGIHIAAPGLFMQPGDALDVLARNRYSTVYVPGSKLTMLPPAVVDAFTLLEGGLRPAVSLYVRFDETTYEMLGHETRLEKVHIAENMRLETVQPLVTRALQDDEEVAFAFQTEIRWLYGLAQVRKVLREEVRGKPETFSRPDYQFRLDGAAGQVCGDERVAIETRARGHPLDVMVSECMILANSTWGGWLAGLGVPAVYRNQAALAPGVKVRMSVKALKHAGIGVDYYAWSTSPLRRYVDLVNQWQIIAAARHGATAGLQAPFKPRDSELFGIISAFEAAYIAYGDFQRQMERFWTLRYLEQEGISSLDAAVIKEGVVRADSLPLVVEVTSPHAQQRGTSVRLDIAGVDLLTLTVRVRELKPSDGMAVSAGSDAADMEDAETMHSAQRLELDSADDNTASGGVASGDTTSGTAPEEAAEADISFAEAMADVQPVRGTRRD